MDSYSADDILAVELWANALPCKILGYRTPDGAFEAEMNGYSLVIDTSWLRISQGQIDDPLTQKMLNLLLQFGVF